MTLVTPMKTDEAETQDTKELRPKVGRIPVTLRVHRDDIVKEETAGYVDSATVSRKSDTQFMLLLLTLFIIVNLVLITLLNHKEKSPAPVAEEADRSAIHDAAAPAAPIKEAPKAPAVINPKDKGAAVASTPSSAPQTLPAAQDNSAQAKAYVTPVSAGTSHATSAPVQPVTVVSPGQLPTMAPSAGTPSASPADATKDLLSVINKD